MAELLFDLSGGAPIDPEREFWDAFWHTVGGVGLAAGPLGGIRAMARGGTLIQPAEQISKPAIYEASKGLHALVEEGRVFEASREFVKMSPAMRTAVAEYMNVAGRTQWARSIGVVQGVAATNVAVSSAGRFTAGQILSGIAAPPAGGAGLSALRGQDGRGAGR